MGKTTICDQCGGRFDRPGLFSCGPKNGHIKPNMAQRIVSAIEDDLRDRRGFRQTFDDMDNTLQCEMRDTWEAPIKKILKRKR